jgi:hypothetical protein
MANAMLDAWQEDGAYRRVELSRCGSESDGGRVQRYFAHERTIGPRWAISARWVLCAVAALFRSGETLEAEILIFHHQLNVVWRKRELYWFWNRPGNRWTPVDILRFDFQNRFNKFKDLRRNSIFYH